jgi:hypothetical protein
MENTALQYAENLAVYKPGTTDPWHLQGTFLGPEDLDAMAHLQLHQGVVACLALRLAILYEAPLDEQLSIIRDGAVSAVALEGTSYGAEWHFLTAIPLIRKGGHEAQLASAIEHLRLHCRSKSGCKSRNYADESGPNFRHRLVLLDAISLLVKDGLEAIRHLDEIIDRFEREQFGIAGGCVVLITRLTEPGLLNLYVGLEILKTTGSKKSAAGYFIAAYRDYNLPGRAGLCEMLRERYPGLPVDKSVETPAPSSSFQVGSTAVKERIRPVHSSSNATTTTISSNSARALADRDREGETADGTLDTLT